MPQKSSPRVRTGGQDGGEHVRDIVADPAVKARLHYLRDRYGYFTRAEFEEAFGLPSPRGRWECPGEFDTSGRLREHCRDCA